MAILLFCLGMLLIVAIILKTKPKTDSSVSLHVDSALNHNGLTQYRIVSPDGEYRYLEYLTSDNRWKPIPQIKIHGRSAEENFSFSLYTYSDDGSNACRHHYYINNNGAGSDYMLEQFVKDNPNIESYFEFYKERMASNRKRDQEEKRQEELRLQENKETRIL